MLRRINHTIATVTSALWLGGAVALLGMVQRVFAFDRELAVRTAPVMFLWFERYQLLLAGVLIITLAIGCTRRRLAVMIPAVLAGAIAVVSATMITPRIDHLRQIGESGTPAFRTLHGVSMSLYFTQVVVLLIVVIAHTWMAQRRPNGLECSTSGAQI